MFKSPLQRALARGLKPGGDLSEELQKLGEYPIRLRKDGKAICDALKLFPLGPGESNGYPPRLYSLVSLFQDVNAESPNAPAFEILCNEGQEHLLRIFDVEIKRVIDDSTNDLLDDLLMVLKILAMYGSREGAEKIVESARRPLKPESYLWQVILALFSDEHPHRDYVFEALSNPLPPAFIAISLLDSANRSALDGKLQRHPFDSPAGWAQLQIWLTDGDPEHFSYAHSATAALPSMSNPARDSLLALAMDHVDVRVQIEAAWVAGKLHRAGGLQMLARYCRDVNHSSIAQQYLAELGREDVIPAEVKEPSFVAQAEFAQWLAHPNELGKPPDELEVVDHRLLAWPPEREPKPFWLIRYCVRDHSGLAEDQVDCGMVGSMTWCFFCYKMHERPPEDAYAVHCYWEMRNSRLVEESEVTDSKEYEGMLNQWQGSHLQNPRILRVVELSSKLAYPTSLVAIASAKLDAQEGWVCLDGPRSSWYPRAEQPTDTTANTVLMIHVGRHLLGFQDSPNRKAYLITDRPQRDSNQIIEVYEKLLHEVLKSPPKRQKEILSSLSSHFDAYVDARVTVQGRAKGDIVLELYERLLLLAEQVDQSIQEDVYDSFGVLGRHFGVYIDALVSVGRSDEVGKLVELFAAHWDHNLGYGELGTAAFKAGKRTIAEHYFLKIHEGLKDYCRAEELSLLAEIWHDRGETARACELLVDCLRKIVVMIQSSKYNSDREMYAVKFEHHRSTYLRFFPDGENELAKLGLPIDPLIAA